MSPSDRRPASLRVLPTIRENTFYPSASLHSTAVDYARFVAALAGNSDSRGRGTTLLRPETMREVLRVQYPQIDRDRGLILGWTKRAEVRVVAHDGRNEGHRASMFFTPEGASPDGATYGVVILSNGDFSVDGMALEPKLGHEILKRAIAGTLED